MDILTNREIAFTIWIAIFLAYCFYYPDIRSGFPKLLKAAFAPKLAIYYATVGILTYFYVSALGQILQVGAQQYKIAIFWYFTSGLAASMNALSSKEYERFFTRYIWQQLSIDSIFSAFLTLASYSIATEFLVIGVVTLLGAMLTVSTKTDEFPDARRLIKFILIGIAAILVTLSFIAAFKDFSDTALSLSIDLGLPFLLSALHTPAAFIMFVAMRIESAHIRWKFDKSNDPQISQYAWKRFLTVFLLKPWLLDRALRQLSTTKVESRTDVEVIIKEIIRHERLLEEIEVFSSAEGWNPLEAGRYLARYDLSTGDYHRSGNSSQWWATSPSRELSQAIIPPNVRYAVEGDKIAARRLRLVYSAWFEYDNDAARSHFRSIMCVLLESALGEADLLGEIDPFSAKEGMTRGENLALNIYREVWDTERGYTLTVTINDNSFDEGTWDW